MVQRREQMVQRRESVLWGHRRQVHRAEGGGGGVHTDKAEKDEPAMMG